MHCMPRVLVEVDETNVPSASHVIFIGAPGFAMNEHKNVNDEIKHAMLKFSTAVCERFSGKVNHVTATNSEQTNEIDTTVTNTFMA